MISQSHEEHIRHSFDSFIKIVTRRKSIDIRREISSRNKREVSFSDLTAQEIISLATTDKYFTDENYIAVFGLDVSVANAELAEALRVLPVDRREIVLMAYFFEMKDREIAESLNMARRTVAKHRADTLIELRNFLESEN